MPEPARARTNCILSADKLPPQKTNCILFFLPLLLAELCWREAVLKFEAAGKGGAEAEA